MRNKTAIFMLSIRFLVVALSFVTVCPALSAPPLVLQPAEITSAAPKAMMLSAATAGRRIVVVGEHGIVLLSDDEGKTFRQAQSVPVRSTLTGVYFIDDRTGWAVGQWGVILQTSDAGNTWQVQRVDTSVDQPIFSIYFKDKDCGWAVGLWSLMLTTSDGGKTWNALELPSPPGSNKADLNLFKIFRSSKGTLLVAAEQGKVLRSEDGVNWTYSDTGYNGTFWSGIALKDGAILVGGLRGTIYRSADDGMSWVKCSSGVKSSITDFCEIGGKTIAVGLDGVFLQTEDGGQSFKTDQREDRLSLTALAVVASSGKLVLFSKQGVVQESPEAASH